MVHTKEYSAIERLRDGSLLEIRALRPGDRDGLLAAVDRTSTESLYRRFFAFKRGFTDKEVEFYVNVDFVSHAAFVAVQEEGGSPMIVGGARYIVVQPHRAEIAFAVDDAHQGKGIGAAMMRHLVSVARKAGLTELVADVLPENAAMLKVLTSSGLPVTNKRDADTIHVEIRLG